MRAAKLLTMRLIGVWDYNVFEDGQHIGRIRFAHARRLALARPGAHPRPRPFGSATSLDDAKQSFKTAWLAFKARHGPQALAAAYRAMNVRNKP